MLFTKFQFRTPKNQKFTFGLVQIILEGRSQKVFVEGIEYTLTIWNFIAIDPLLKKIFLAQC